MRTWQLARAFECRGHATTGDVKGAGQRGEVFFRPNGKDCVPRLFFLFAQLMKRNFGFYAQREVLLEAK